MQKYRPNWLSEISVFWPKISDFRLQQHLRPQIELGITKTISEGFGPLWYRPNKFRSPSPKKSSILGVQNFLQNRLFGLNFSSFRFWEAYRAPKWFGRHKNFSRELWSPFGARRKTFGHPPQKGRFWGTEICAKPILTNFWSKKVFWPFFWVDRESFIEWLKDG